MGAPTSAASHCGQLPGIGQKDSLLCYYLVSPKGSDADIQERLGLKVSQFLGLMGEAPQSAVLEAENANMARQHAEKLLMQYYPQLPMSEFDK